MQLVKNSKRDIREGRIERLESPIRTDNFIDAAAAFLLLLVLWLVTAFVFSI